MKKTQLLMLGILATTLALTGCSSRNVAADKATAEPTPTITPTPTPTPQLMTIEEAAKYYLATVCPANLTVTPNNNAFNAQDLTAIKATSIAERDAMRAEATAFSNPMVVWPAEISADIQKLTASDFKVIALMDALATASTLDAANAYSASYVPDDSPAAAQHIRLVLNLPADTSAGC
jgi:hypothetical protein